MTTYLSIRLYTFADYAGVVETVTAKCFDEAYELLMNKRAFLRSVTKIPLISMYRGYVIEKESEPWRVKYGMNFAVYSDTKDDSTKYAATFKEAKEIIDEIIE